MKSNTQKYEINDIGEFSDLNEVILATKGKYGVYKDKNYRLTIISDICFIHTFKSCTIEIPSHYIFTFIDDDDKHLVDESTRTIDVNGVTSFSFIVK